MRRFQAMRRFAVGRRERTTKIGISENSKRKWVSDERNLAFLPDTDHASSKTQSGRTTGLDIHNNFDPVFRKMSYSECDYKNKFKTNVKFGNGFQQKIAKGGVHVSNS